MKFEKRAYETRAVRELLDTLPSDKRVLAVAPTGSGKTVVASMLVKRGPWKRVLFVAHTRELIYQAHRKLADNGVRAGIVMAADEVLNGAKNVAPDAPVQVASVQTLAHRGLSFRPDLIILDEAHRSTADSYQEIVAASPRAVVLGLTATPTRMDGKGLGEFFRSLVSIARPSELYAQGYLAKPRVFAAPESAVAKLGERLKSVRAAHGDYMLSDLAKAVDSPVLIGNVVSESLRLAPGVPKVVFAAGREHSRKIAKRFRARGIVAEHLDGETEATERERILAGLASGSIEVVCNVDVLSEGWDLPALGAVILARPTKSLARYLQMCGRVQRPYKNRVPLVLDHGNNAYRHQILPFDDVPWSLDGTHRHKGEPVTKACVACQEMIAAGRATCPECGAEQPMDPRRRRELEEERARLEEVTSLRARVEAFAKERGIGMDWVERVVAAESAA